MKEFCLLCIATVIFALTFVIAGVTALVISHGISLIDLCSGEYGNCVDTSAEQMFIIAAFFAVVAVGIASVAWLILWENDMPHRLVLPVWVLTFASVVAYVTYLGEEAAGIYIGGILWLPVSIIFGVCLHLYLVWHYRRRQLPPRRTRDRK